MVAYLSKYPRPKQQNMHKNNMYKREHLLTVWPGKNPTVTAPPLLSLESLPLQALTLPRVDAECRLQPTALWSAYMGKCSRTGPTWS